MTKANQLIERLLKNWKQKIFCFIFAVIIYIFHQTTLLDKRSFVLPLQIIQDGLVMPVGNYDKNVAVTVRANTEEITSVHPSQIIASVNLDNITKNGEYILPVNIEIAQELMDYDPFEVKVKPETIKIKVEKKALKYINVSPSIVGEPAHGYYVKSVDVEPSFLKISGPETMLQEIDSLITDEIEINNVTSSQSVEVNGIVLNKIITVDNEGPYKVTVNVEPQIMQKSFENFKIQPISLSPDCEIISELPKASLILEGIVPMLENFNLNAYSVQVDLSSIKDSGTYDLPVKYVYPSYFKLKEKSVDKVSIEIKKIIKEEPVETETTENSEMNGENLSENISEIKTDSKADGV